MGYPFEVAKAFSGSSLILLIFYVVLPTGIGHKALHLPNWMAIILVIN